MYEVVPQPVPHKETPEELRARVEREACFEGNESELLFQRLERPEIKEQLVTIYLQAYEDRLKSGPATKTVLDEDGVFRDVPYVAPSREEIEAIIDQRIERAKSVTFVEWSGIKQPCVNVVKEELEDFAVPHPFPSHAAFVNMQWKMPESALTPSTKQWSIVEAHEKGHQIRRFGDRDIRAFFKALFSEAFDVSHLIYTDEEYERDKKENDLEDLTYEEMLRETQDYLGDANEIAERMSQLKAYFGMRGIEEFTGAHLAYARVHYIEDTGMNNGMSNFFRCITPEKEQAFLHVINSVGI